ncbi:hypothetical protein [Halorubrum amylolyticum]|uniref:hypothetical protein n=1 Tax=Halorubrum amylolyticum TaxID=2508724 RepID=UPI001009291E|nr:hypothetical protein [Halorubrum amylolyticum]
MLRAIIGVLGGLTALVPDRIVDAFERAAVANPDEVEPRPGAVTALRAEGVFVFALTLSGGRVYASAMYITGAFGALLLAVPRLYRAIAAGFLYGDPEAVEWREGFDPVLRLVGALYVLLGIREFRREREEA